MEPAALLATAREGTFFSYAAGVAHHMLTHYRVGGLEIDNFETDLPLKKGLSSSAAFCVLVARAFDRVYNLRLTVRGEMECAFAGERLTPSKCGRMDQACANGSRPVVMTYDADFLAVEPISISEPLYLVLVDLRSEKSTVRILNALQGCYPVATTAEHRNVQHALGIGNLDITSRALAAMEAGDAQQLGAIMDESHALFTAAGSAVCPEELLAPVLQGVLNHPLIRPLVWGGKGVGAGGDGTAQFVCKSLAAQQEVVRLVERELKMHPIPLTIEPSTTVRSAVVPVAGFASSLFPATKVVSPPLFPICDGDGVTKPAILIVVEELCAAGFDKIVLVYTYKETYKDL
jgi:mevalonate kinase